MAHHLYLRSLAVLLNPVGDVNVWAFGPNLDLFQRNAPLRYNPLLTVLTNALHPQLLPLHQYFSLHPEVVERVAFVQLERVAERKAAREAGGHEGRLLQAGQNFLDRLLNTRAGYSRISAAPQTQL